MRTAFFTLLVLTVSCFTGEVSYSQDTEQKAILITGATTGIGRNLAETLAADGHFVYAGARKQSDMDALNALDNVMAVRLDVTKQEDIDAAVQTITREGRGLYGLVNNAGVAIVAPMIEVSEDDMQFQMDVNLFGPYRVTKAFAPLIIESKGRITTTGSISGILSSGFLGPYSMSKHAIEAYADTLATEMEKFDVEVSVVEPGNYNSAISQSLMRRLARSNDGSAKSLYEEELTARLSGDGSRAQYKEPDEVSAAFVHFLFDDNPKRRYMVVPDQREAEITIKKAISELAQLNERHEYTYSRDELFAMLDEALEPEGN
jgi:NAD(P)-dependent dehydrogenase (short-subunit alcohol dehydrogenase family)